MATLFGITLSNVTLLGLYYAFTSNEGGWYPALRILGFTVCGHLFALGLKRIDDQYTREKLAMLQARAEFLERRALELSIRVDELQK